jgi:hypothetical protein
MKSQDGSNTLVGQIKAAHEEAGKHARSGIEASIRAGELLAEAKKGEGHGKWMRFLREELPGLAQSTANLYMSFHFHRHILADPGITTVREALAAIAKVKAKDKPARESAAATSFLDDAQGWFRRLKRKPAPVSGDDEEALNQAVAPALSAWSGMQPEVRGWFLRRVLLGDSPSPVAAETPPAENPKPVENPKRKRAMLD